MIVNEQELISSKDDDIFLYENKENKPNQSKKSKKKNDLINNLKKNLVDVKDSENYRKKRPCGKVHKKLATKCSQIIHTVLVLTISMQTFM